MSSPPRKDGAREPQRLRVALGLGNSRRNRNRCIIDLGDGWRCRLHRRIKIKVQVPRYLDIKIVLLPLLGASNNKVDGPLSKPAGPTGSDRHSPFPIPIRWDPRSNRIPPSDRIPAHAQLLAPPDPRPSDHHAPPPTDLPPPIFHHNLRLFSALCLIQLMHRLCLVLPPAFVPPEFLHRRQFAFPSPPHARFHFCFPRGSPSTPNSSITPPSRHFRLLMLRLSIWMKWMEKSARRCVFRIQMKWRRRCLASLLNLNPRHPKCARFGAFRTSQI